MESKYYTQKINGVTNNIYTNEIYNLLIGTDGNVNLNRKIADSNMIINQLIEDLVRTNKKMDTMLNVIENVIKQGFITSEYAQQLSEYVYGQENDKSRNK